MRRNLGGNRQRHDRRVIEQFGPGLRVQQSDGLITTHPVQRLPGGTS